MSDIVFDPSKQAWCHTPSGSCSGLGETPQLPTYRTIAAVLEKKTGSGVRLLGWTVARTLLIAPAMRIVGVPWKQAFGGALVASMAISALALIRVYRAEYEVSQDYLSQRQWLQPRQLTGRSKRRG